MTPSKQDSKEPKVRQENQRVAQYVGQGDHDVVRLLSSDEIAAASDFYDAAPCTD